ncbi:MAG: hypothetical protein IKO04_04020 [Bacteroidales bacterium]|nr:hypothetical protein [Bacteroidales bacterium]
MQADYTPYGRKIENEMFTSGNSPYLWCGKEYESFIDIPWYDSEARFLTTTGVFTSTDPLCEKYYHISPYTYCAGDPINKVDPEGNWMETLWDVANVVMDVKSFVNNIKEGNALGAVVDGVATIVDVAGTMLPLIPSGAGTIIKSVRAADKVVDVSKVAKGSKTVDKASDAVKTVHGNSKLSAKAQHAYDVIDTDTGNVVKTGVSGGPINKQGKSVRAESQASKWNKQDGRNHYETRITHIEDAGEGSRAKILEYEKNRADEVRNQLDPNKHQRP